MRDKLVFKALETELLRWFDPEGPRILRSDVRHFCPSSDNDIVDVLSLGEPRVELKRLAIPKDEGRLSPASSSRSMDVVLSVRRADEGDRHNSLGYWVRSLEALGDDVEMPAGDLLFEVHDSEF